MLLPPQPEVTYAVQAPGNTYMFSRGDAVILGGVAEKSDKAELDPTRPPRSSRAMPRCSAAWAALERRRAGPDIFPT